jgi:DNA-binding transcriptional LysR family regulator
MSKPAGAFTTSPLGTMSFVYAVAPDHPLAGADQPLTESDIAAFPAAVAADTSRSLPPGSVGIFRRQRTLTVTNIDQKIAVQKAGLAVGWLPEPRIRSLLESGELLALEVHEPRQPVMLYLARHSEDQGKALMWFWERLTGSAAISDWLNSPAE